MVLNMVVLIAHIRVKRRAEGSARRVERNCRLRKCVKGHVRKGKCEMASMKASLKYEV